jgi:AcrR family transcriptional regulator
VASSSVGRRLAPEARREQIVDVGAERFAALPYERVRMADVAAQARISRALVYRYFPTKRDLFAAVYERASERLLAASELVPDLPLAEQVLSGLDAHFDFFVENARTVLVANRGELAGDPLIEGIASRELAELRRRMLDAGGLRGHARARASIALSGWLAFVRAVCVEWLADPGRVLSREEVRDMCLSALLSTLASETATPEASSHSARE